MNSALSIPDDHDAVVQAAKAFAGFRDRLADMEQQLRDATVALEGRNTRIEQLERAVDEAWLRVAQLQNDRDLAVLERDEMRCIFYSFKAQLDAVVIPMPSPPSKRRRKSDGATANGNGNGENEKADPAGNSEHVVSVDVAGGARVGD